MGLQTAADKKDPEDVQKTLAALADNELARCRPSWSCAPNPTLCWESSSRPPTCRLPTCCRRSRTASWPPQVASARLLLLKDAETSKLVDELVKSGKDNIFELKQKELAATDRHQRGDGKSRACPEFEKEVSEPWNAQRGRGSRRGPRIAGGDPAGPDYPDLLALVSLHRTRDRLVLCRPWGGAPPCAACRTA